MKKILVMNDERLVCLNQLFDISFLTNQDMESTMVELLDKKSNYEKTTFSQPFVFYSGLSEEEMQQASHCIKENGIQAIQVAQTPFNATWKLKDLLDEVKKEHEIFHTKQQLSNLIKQTMTLPFDEEKKNRITQQLMNAMKAYTDENLNEMQDAIQSLIHLLCQENM